MEQNKERKTLSKKDVVKSFWRWTFFSHANYNYERLAGTGFCHAMAPIIEKLYKDNPEEYKAAVQRHIEFYNTEPHFGGVINGMVIAMEEERANGAPISDEAINGIKTGLMGPFAGIGDTLWQGTLTPILLSIGISLASSGSLAGPAGLCRLDDGDHVKHRVLCLDDRLQAGQGRLAADSGKQSDQKGSSPGPALWARLSWVR